MIDRAVLEGKVAELLDDFYRRRTAKINELKLLNVLRRKNPYLFKALGIGKASEIVEGILAATVSSSDEALFGDAFVEPLAKFVSGGTVAPSEGVDVAIETDDTYRAIAVKSGPSVFNAQSRKRQEEDFQALEKRLRKLRKRFDPIVGYCYGRKQQRESTHSRFRELAGQAFWEEITGDPDFYLTIMALMRDLPEQHRVAYTEAYSAAVNRFTKEFVEQFCHDDGSIDWEKLARFNSGQSGSSIKTI
jgi:hypothetical protein